MGVTSGGELGPAFIGRRGRVESVVCSALLLLLNWKEEVRVGARASRRRRRSLVSLLASSSTLDCCAAGYTEPVQSQSHPLPPPVLLRSLPFISLRNCMKRSFPSDSIYSNSTNQYSQSYNSMAPPPRRGAYQGNKRPRGGGPSSSSSSTPRGPPAPSVPGPYLDSHHVLTTFSPAARQRAAPQQYEKWTENPKGVIANYCKAIATDAKYTAQRVNIEGKGDVYRCV